MSNPRITVPGDCGNAPKKLMLVDMVTAYASEDHDGFLACVAEEIEWVVAGGATFAGRSALATAVADADKEVSGIVEVTIHRVLTHGRFGAIEGTMAINDGQGKAFCTVVTFSSHAKDAKIKQATSFVANMPL